MKKMHGGVEFLLQMAKVNAIFTRKLDSRLGGLGFTEFILLYYVNEAEGGRMRRTDLAEQMGLTVSGITRLLLPREKIGLIKREADKNDARVSYVILGASAKEKLAEGLERAELFVEDAAPATKLKKLEEFSKLLKELV
jgi:DNA-binding MarR family transcriptional regulator